MVVTVNLKVGLLVGKTVQKLSHNKKKTISFVRIKGGMSNSQFPPFLSKLFFFDLEKKKQEKVIRQ